MLVFINFLLAVLLLIINISHWSESYRLFFLTTNIRFIITLQMGCCFHSSLCTCVL
uniref:Uncharacterized protein n=1 Tax=Arundo donax TaxID=35708 RepID=A0A0A9H559_ARUDO